MADAIGCLTAKALYDGPERDVFYRVGRAQDRIYLDLADDHGRVVEVDGSGWRVSAGGSPRMRRVPGMQPLPMPEVGGSVLELRPFVNVTEDDFVLVVAFLIAALRPDGPFPIMVLQGEQGSAKSTTARVIRTLVDPSAAPLKTPPKNEENLFIEADNNWILAFDNLSGIQDWLADGFCRIATGAGMATRRLYTNRAEEVFQVCRPQVLNGIEDLATRDDPRDRSLVFELPVVDGGRRMSEARFWEAFEKVRPRVLGALLDALTAAVANDGVRIDAAIPRIADFAEFVMRAEPALPWEPGTIEAAYERNRSNAISVSINQSVVAQELIRLAERGSFDGTPTELYHALGGGEMHRKYDGWPRGVPAFSGAVKRLKPALRQIGIDVNEYRMSDRQRTRRYSVRRI